MEVSGKIGLAIDNAVAASRWRIAARFEGRETATLYRAHAESRSAAATALLEEFATDGRDEPAVRHSTQPRQGGC